MTVSERPASAEWFADLFLGYASTDSSDLEIDAPAVTPLTIVFEDVDFDNSIVVGGRFGHWFESLPFLGLALDLSYFQADIPAQDVFDRLIGADVLEDIDGDVLAISLDLMARWGWLTSDEFSHGRLQAYVAIGPGLFVAEASDTTTLTPPGQNSTDTTIGLKAGAGLAWHVVERVALFVEYRFTHFRPEFDFRDRGADETIQIDVDTHHVLGGVSFRF